MKKAREFKNKMDKKEYPETIEGLGQMNKDNEEYKKLAYEATLELLKEKNVISKD